MLHGRCGSAGITILPTIELEPHRAAGRRLTASVTAAGERHLKVDQVMLRDRPGAQHRRASACEAAGVELGRDRRASGRCLLAHQRRQHLRGRRRHQPGAALTPVAIAEGRAFAETAVQRQPDRGRSPHHPDRRVHAAADRHRRPHRGAGAQLLRRDRRLPSGFRPMKQHAQPAGTSAR